MHVESVPCRRESARQAEIAVPGEVKSMEYVRRVTQAAQRVLESTRPQGLSPVRAMKASKKVTVMRPGRASANGWKERVMVQVANAKMAEAYAIVRPHGVVEQVMACCWCSPL